MNIEQRVMLIEAAKLAALNAYARYSKFRVGAAVLSESGQIYTGANIENASYGLTLCAERAALASARSQGATKFVGIAVACIDADNNTGLLEKVPCGACRQWIQELAPDAEILLLGVDRIFTITDFLPIPFKLQSE